MELLRCSAGDCIILWKFLPLHSRVLEHARNNNYEKLDKHRFLVLSKAMEFDEYERISKLSGSEKQTEVSDFLFYFDGANLSFDNCIL